MKSSIIQKYFFFITFMLMASAFLPLVFNNLPPLIRSHHIWTFIWAVSLIFFYPKIFVNKLIILVLVYGLVLLIAIKTMWSNIDNWNSQMLINEFYQIAIGISVLTYFLQRKDYKNLARITKWSLIFILITAIMSIVSSTLDPMYARNIVGISAIDIESERDAILSFKQYGGGNYSAASAFMCLFPIFVFYFRNIKISIFSKRQIVAIVIILFLALIGIQIVANVIIAIVFAVLALFGMNKLKQSILLIMIFFSILIVIPKDMYIKSLVSIGDKFGKDSEISNKFKDIAMFLELGYDITDKKTGLSNRAERYPMLIETFAKSPLLGCYFLSDKSGNGYDVEGGHLHWMNKLVIMGVLGFSFFGFILYSLIKKNLQYLSSNFKFYYILASLSIIIHGFMKTVVGRETWYAFIILLPGMYYLQLLKKNKKKFRR